MSLSKMLASFHVRRPCHTERFVVGQVEKHKSLTIVASHKRIAIAASHLAIHEFPGTLEGDVHVAVNGLELA